MSAVELAHDVHGPADAPVVILGSSIGSTRDMWERALPVLAERFRVVRYDARGHGASPVPDGPYAISDLAGDVLALADRLGVERFSFAGLSLGGMTGMWLGAHAPERIERLVLLCTVPHYEDAAAWRERAALVRAEGSGAVADASMARWFTDGFRAAEPATVAAFRAGLAATPAEGYAACCEALAVLDLRADLAAITAPTLVIAGREDAAAPPEAMRAIADGIAGAGFEILSPAAHLAAVERHETVAPLILDHLQQGSST